MTVIDFKTRTSILVEDVTNERDQAQVVVDGVDVGNAKEILVVTNSEDGEISIHTNMDDRSLVYLLEVVKLGFLTKGNDNED